MTLQAVRLKGRIAPKGNLELLEPMPALPEGEVELILLYPVSPTESTQGRVLSPLEWPVLDGGRYLGGSLRREEIYDDDGR